MNVGPDAAGKAAVLTKLYDRTRDIAGARQHRPCMTRRQFTRTATGTAVFGGALGAGFLKPALASNWSFAPAPIPGGSPSLGGASRASCSKATAGRDATADPGHLFRGTSSGGATNFSRRFEASGR
jgi:hypothetical protein